MNYFIGFFLGFTATFAIVIFSGSQPASQWHQRLIEAGLAEFTVDPTTGDTTFIIYAEQTTDK